MTKMSEKKLQKRGEKNNKTSKRRTIRQKDRKKRQKFWEKKKVLISNFDPEKLKVAGRQEDNTRVKEVKEGEFLNSNGGM